MVNCVEGLFLSFITGVYSVRELYPIAFRVPCMLAKNIKSGEPFHVFMTRHNVFNIITTSPALSKFSQLSRPAASL